MNKSDLCGVSGSIDVLPGCKIHSISEWKPRFVVAKEQISAKKNERIWPTTELSEWKRDLVVANMKWLQTGKWAEVKKEERHNVKSASS